MKTITNRFSLLIAIMLFSGFAAMAQTANVKNSSKTKNKIEMKTYMIEREFPGAGKLTAAQLKEISKASCAVLDDMGPRIEWVQSYVVADKLVCIYKAENPELIREHAKKGNFPCTNITEVANIISPATAK